MMLSIEGRPVLFALAVLICVGLSPSVYGLPTPVAKSVTKDVKAEEHTLNAPIADITNELEKLLTTMKQNEKLRRARETGTPPPGPKNVVLIMTRDALTSGHNATEEKRSLLEAFPVSHYVKDKMKRSPDEPLLVVAPKLLPRQGSYDSTKSCQAALDHAVDALLETARSKRQMVTGVLATESVSMDPLTNFLQKRSISHESGEHAVAKRSADKEDDPEKKQEEVSSAIEPINDKFQKIGIEDKGSGILYKKVEIVGGAKKTEVAQPAKETKEKVAKREAEDTEKKAAVAGRADETDGFDFFRAMDRMRLSFLDHFFRGMGFGYPDVEGPEESSFGRGSPMVGLVDNTLSDLQREARDTGFLLVVSGGDANEANEMVKLVRRKVSPTDTLVVVTGLCPEPEGKEMNSNFWQFDPSNQMKFSSDEQRILPKKNREVTMIPLYASGPKSERLTEVDTLWSVPELIKNITMENPMPKTNPREKEFYLYKTDEDKSAVMSPFGLKVMKDKVEEKTSVDKKEVFPKKHRVGREVSSAEWSQVSPQHVREKMAAPEDEGPEPEVDAAPVPDSWFAEEDYNNEIPREGEPQQQQLHKDVPPVAVEAQLKDNVLVKEAAAGSAVVSACALTYASLAVIRLF